MEIYNLKKKKKKIFRKCEISYNIKKERKKKEH